MEDSIYPHNRQVLVAHDRDGLDVELAVEEKRRSGDKKDLNVRESERIQSARTGELGEEQEPFQSNKRKFRRFLRRIKPAIHLFIWMLVTT
jgi:hypothetical protein